MQRCIRIAAAAACRCAFRYLRQVGTSRHTFFDGHGCTMGGTAGLPLTAAARRQTTTPDKRFHCSVCKKAFRLEMAAKLHVQQVHGGEGTVEAGAGPGQSEEQSAQTPIGVFRNVPPQAPTVVTPVQADVHERSARREKPAPKPLHQAEREVPSLVMEKMLSVWDDIGVKRMGNQFVHSSMVMRVFAARPSDSVEPLYGIFSPEGENPFAGADHTPAVAADNHSSSTGTHESNIYNFDVSDAFAMAAADAFGQCRPARCPNPFLTKYTREVSATAARAEVAEQQTAPVTPFGQLPIFGQLPSQVPPPPPAQPTPETAATAVTTAKSCGHVVSSPFAAGAEDSPFAGTVATPFADVGYSPFAAASPTATPDATSAPLTPAPENAATSAVHAEAAAAIPSPFLPAGAVGAAAAASPFAAAAASPFVASPFTTADGGVPAGDFAGADTAYSYAAVAGAVPAAAEASAAHVCSLCEKSFSTHEGLRMHSKAKHALDLPKEKSAAKRRSVPDLPAYIPSPVDLAMTSPFGSSAQTTAWADVELTPYAQSLSNITVAGRVVDVDAAQDGSELLTVFVRGTGGSGDEFISVQCSAEAMKTVSSSFHRGETVFACGTLRLLPITEEATKKTFASPIVYVTSPTGVVAKLRTL